MLSSWPASVAARAGQGSTPRSCLRTPPAVWPSPCSQAGSVSRQCPGHEAQALPSPLDKQSLLASQRVGWPHCHPVHLFGYTLGSVSEAQRSVRMTQCWVFAAGERSHLLLCSEISAKHPGSSLVGSACHPTKQLIRVSATLSQESPFVHVPHFHRPHQNGLYRLRF